MKGIIVTSCLIGALGIGATLRLNRAAPTEITEEYGKRLLTHTPGTNFSCLACHADSGTLSLPDAYKHYPRFSARQGVTTTIEDRINECMQRSMNTKQLAKSSPQMKAMASYIKGLSETAAASAPVKGPKEPPVFKTPPRAADLAAGKRILEENCASCHGKNGQGLFATRDANQGYLFPPLWGPDSFNDGAGMHRILTAAKFIKAKMPLGKANLTDDQAFDVAGYINSQPRPEMPNLAKDYPDLTKKPIDNAYGPYADPFPQQQHQFGPFPPIEAFMRQSAAKKPHT